MASTIAFDGGLTVSLSVADMDRSIDWYKQILGFDLLYRADEIGWCELKSSVDRVNVGLSVVEQPQPGGGATPVFGVTDIAAAHQALQAQGIKLDGDVQTIEGLVKLLTLFDPDGNTLMLYQDLQS